MSSLALRCCRFTLLPVWTLIQTKATWIKPWKSLSSKLKKLRLNMTQSTENGLCHCKYSLHFIFFVSFFFFLINILAVIVQTHLWLVVENCRQIDGRANAENYTWQRLEMSGSSFWTLRSGAVCPSYEGFTTNWVVKWDRCWGLKRPR